MSERDAVTNTKDVKFPSSCFVTLLDIGPRLWSSTVSWWSCDRGTFSAPPPCVRSIWSSFLGQGHMRTSGLTTGPRPEVTVEGETLLQHRIQDNTLIGSNPHLSFLSSSFVAIKHFCKCFIAVTYGVWLQQTFTLLLHWRVCNFVNYVKYKSETKCKHGLWLSLEIQLHSCITNQIHLWRCCYPSSTEGGSTALQNKTET